MKKLFLIIVAVLFSSVISTAQNMLNAINTDNNQLGNNPGNVGNVIDNRNPQVNINNQLASNQLANNDYINIRNNTQTQQQNITQISNNRNSINTLSIASSKSAYKTKTYTTYGSPAKKHTLKLNFKIGKVHFMRKYFNESAIFKAKTYNKIFTSKKKSIKKCFTF